MVVCTLCSCYPWEVLGLPPVWYKSAPYRSRAVKDPRGVLADFGVEAAEGDGDPRMGFHRRDTLHLVLPMRPAGTEGWSEDKLADLVTRDSMIGTGLPKPSGGAAMNGVHDMGGMDGFGKVESKRTSRRSMRPWEGRVMAMQRAMGYAGAWHIDMFARPRERQPPTIYLAASYYKSWALAMRSRRSSRGFVTPEELKAGHALAPAKPLPRRLPPAGGGGASGAADTNGLRQQRRRNSSRATACGPRTSIRQRIRGCPDTRADDSA